MTVARTPALEVDNGRQRSGNLLPRNFVKRTVVDASSSSLRIRSGPTTQTLANIRRARATKSDTRYFVDIMLDVKRPRSSTTPDDDYDAFESQRPRANIPPGRPTGPASRAILALYAKTVMRARGYVTTQPRLVVYFRHPEHVATFTTRFFNRTVQTDFDDRFESGSTLFDIKLRAHLRSTQLKKSADEDLPRHEPDKFLRQFGDEFVARAVLVVDIASARQLNTTIKYVQDYASDHFMAITYSTATSPDPISELPPSVAVRPFVVHLANIRMPLDDTDDGPVALVLSGVSWW